MNESEDCVSIIADNVNNNVVNVIINESFGDQAIVDTGSFLSFVDYNFCKKHNLRVIPLQTGESRSYIAAGETRITAIGSTNLVLTFAGEQFPQNFQIIKNLSTNILIGVNFIRKYNCVPYVFQGIFALEESRITVPLVVKGDMLGVAHLKEEVTLQPYMIHLVKIQCPQIEGESAFLLEPLVNVDAKGFCMPRTILANTGWHHCQLWNPTDTPILLIAGTFIGQLTPLQDIVSIAQENAPAAIKIDAPCYVTGNSGQGDYPRPSDCGPRNKHRRYSADRVLCFPDEFSERRK